MVRQLIDRVSAVIREEGPTAVLAKMASVATQMFHYHGPDNFDADLHVETSRTVPLWRLRIPSKNASFGSKYQTTDPEVFLKAVRMVPSDFRDFTFIDLGCGKGRTLILASKEGVRRVIGVEFSPELAAIARQNLDQVGVSAEIVEIDASRFSFVDGNLLIYLYNPFGRSVMRSVIANLVEWRSTHQNQAFLVYINPACGPEIDSSGAFEFLTSCEQLSIWKLR